MNKITKKLATTTFYLLDLRGKNVGIFEQLKMEEALFRANKNNWLIFNSLDHVNERAVVFGLGDGRKPDTLCNVDIARKDEIPLIKRYSGGGTVFVDKGTRFISFICNENFLIENKNNINDGKKNVTSDKIENNNVSNSDQQSVLNFPRPIMEWTGGLYKDAFDHIFYGKKMDLDNNNDKNNLNLFNLRENDYIYDDRKFGGNAQSISKNRFVHHTSFLYDYNAELMSKYLHVPKKQPDYRDQRDHDSFLCKLKDILPNSSSCDTLENAILKVLEEDRQFNIINIEEVNAGSKTIKEMGGGSNDDDSIYYHKMIESMLLDNNYRQSNVYI